MQIPVRNENCFTVMEEHMIFGPCYEGLSLNRGTKTRKLQYLTRNYFGRFIRNCLIVLASSYTLPIIANNYDDRDILNHILPPYHVLHSHNLHVADESVAIWDSYS